MTIEQFQQLIERVYYEKDSGRGLSATFMWFTEEVGELASALLRGDPEQAGEEFGDVLAWLCTLASIAGIDLEQVAVDKYAQGCPKCHHVPCQCPEPRSS